MSDRAMAILRQLERQGVKASSLCADSRQVAPGDVFLAMKGYRVDGRDYIADAVKRGAAAVLYEQEGAGAVNPGAPNIAVADLASLAGEIAHLVYGRPSERLWMAGVTGTNGKTSVSQWIAQVMNAWDCKCAVIGTLGNGYPGELAPSPNTTPDAIALHRALANFAGQGATACAMEVSSIGLDQGRVAGIHFDVAVFTNLTRDHLEYHGSMEAYGEAKARLFETPALSAAVLNLDDAFGRELAARCKGRVRTIGYTLEDRGGADEVLAAKNLSMSGQGIAFDLDGIHCTAPMVGRFNASNLLAVIGALLAGAPLPPGRPKAGAATGPEPRSGEHPSPPREGRAGGAGLMDIAAVLPQLSPPPGRMQAVGGANAPLVVVDYAHSPDALEKALTALRETAAARGGNLVCVFGCGGERDAGKRPLMGAVAERLADRVVVTSDNPRAEEPQAIIAAILAGMKTRPAVEPDRAAAIAAAVAVAAARDVILLAGKGHEPYQEIAGVRHPFSDVDAAKSALAARR